MKKPINAPSPILDSIAPTPAKVSLDPEYFPGFRTYWMNAILCSDLPSHARGVLLAIGIVFMDESGRAAHPTIQKIAKCMRLSARRTQDHLNRAVEDGWLERRRFGKAKHNRRWQYQATIRRHPAEPVMPLRLMRDGRH